MNTGLRIIYSLLLVMPGLASAVFGQAPTIVTTPDLSLTDDDKVIIAYDIKNENSGDRYNVWVEVTDVNDKAFQARSLSGDIGDGLRGGSGKTIIWDADADGFNLEEGVFIQVMARLIPQAPEEVSEPIRDNSGDKKVNAGVMVLQSLPLPGLGLSRATNGKPHWLRGVVGYGCIAGSVTMNRMAVSSYEDYQRATDASERDELFSTAKMQDDVSEIFAYTAIGVWVTDIVWTLLAAKKINSSEYAQNGGISIRTFYDPGARAPMLSFRYSF